MLLPLLGVADRIRHQIVDRRPAGARRQFAGDGAGLLGAARSAAGDLEDAGAEFAEHAGERPALVVITVAGGVAAILRRGAKAERAVIHRLADQPLHRRHFFRGGLDALVGGFAHHIAADAGMADQRADIDAALFAERIEIIADRLPGHIDPGLQHRQRDLLGVGEKFEIPLAVAGTHRRDHLAALADDDRGVAVMHPGAAIGVPYRLRVEMGVVVDKARRDDAPRGIDRPLGGGAVRLADADDLAVLHGHIGLECRLAGAVDDASVPDQKIVGHRFPPVAPLVGLCRLGSAYRHVRLCLTRRCDNMHYRGDALRPEHASNTQCSKTCINRHRFSEKAKIAPRSGG